MNVCRLFLSFRLVLDFCFVHGIDSDSIMLNLIVKAKERDIEVLSVLWSE